MYTLQRRRGVNRITKTVGSCHSSDSCVLAFIGRAADEQITELFAFEDVALHGEKFLVFEDRKQVARSGTVNPWRALRNSQVAVVKKSRSYLSLGFTIGQFISCSNRPYNLSGFAALHSIQEAFYTL